MASLNMAKVNTLFKKGYLLAGVIIAANIFVGNEMMAMETNPQEEENEKYMKNENHEQQKENKEDSGIPIKDASLLKRGLNFVLKYENTFNFFGGLFFSVANNYLKLWDYNPGGYWNLRIGCLGLRSKRLLNGMLQFEGNFNLGRGFLWLLLGAYNLIKYFATNEKNSADDADDIEHLYVSTLVGESVYKRFGNNENVGNAALIVAFLLQGFVSMPLTEHLSNFSISRSLDSLIWGITGFFLEKKEQKPNEGAKEQGNQIIIDEQKANQETDPKKENEDSDKDN